MSSLEQHLDLEQLVEKASILIEALPYIRRFRGKEVLIKYGGAAMQDKKMQESVLHDIVFMSYVGIKPILIHGGGPNITENLKKAGIQSRFVNGLRVTDEKTIDVVVDTLAELNKEIVHDINRFGARAIGFSGHDEEIYSVVKHESDGDVGFVGDVVSVNILPVREMTELNIIPVIYPVGLDENGKVPWGKKFVAVQLSSFLRLFSSNSFAATTTRLLRQCPTGCSCFGLPDRLRLLSNYQ